MWLREGEGEKMAEWSERLDSIGSASVTRLESALVIIKSRVWWAAWVRTFECWTKPNKSNKSCRCQVRGSSVTSTWNLKSLIMINSPSYDNRLLNSGEKSSKNFAFCFWQMVGVIDSHKGKVILADSNIQVKCLKRCKSSKRASYSTEDTPEEDTDFTLRSSKARLVMELINNRSHFCDFEICFVGGNLQKIIDFFNWKI